MARLAIVLTSLVATQIFTQGPLSQAQLDGKDRSGAEIYATVCSQCHITETPGLKAPSVEALRRLNAMQIKDALYLGPMDDVGKSLSDQEIDNIAAFLTTPAPPPKGSAASQTAP